MAADVLLPATAADVLLQATAVAIRHRAATAADRRTVVAADRTEAEATGAADMGGNTALGCLPA
ncbi:MAG: hypothetical protein WBQ19_20785 [Terriglobales bacterium]